MALYLGIDGGGTGCRAAVADGQGRILGLGAGGPANVATSPTGALQAILAATRAALAAADLPEAEMGRLHAALGLAGANVPGPAAALGAELPFARHRIVSDVMTATLGALQGADGIVAAIGTGSAFGVIRGGRFRSHGGHGFLLGDDGSGAVLGRNLLVQALRASDGFVPMTPALQDILTEYGGVAGVISFGLRATPAEFARHAPQILTAEDPAVRGIFEAAAEQIAAQIDHLQGTAPVPVMFLGGLGPHYAARLAGRWDIRPAGGSALDGAVRLALQEG